MLTLGEVGSLEQQVTQETVVLLCASDSNAVICTHEELRMDLGAKHGGTGW